MKSEKILLKVNGKDIPMNDFVKDILSKTILGMLSALKGMEDMREVEIRITFSDKGRGKPCQK